MFNRDEVQFASGYPCTVSEVKAGIGSTCTRPMPGDILLQVNDINVSRTQAKAVHKLMKFVLSYISHLKITHSSFLITETYPYRSLFSYTVVQYRQHL